jgi:hypothetical protein
MEYVAVGVLIGFIVLIITRLRKKRPTDGPGTGGGRDDDADPTKRRKG